MPSETIFMKCAQLLIGLVGTQGLVGSKKITIPSDLRLPSRTLRVFQRKPCGYSNASILRSQRAKLLRASATTLKFRACIPTPCEAATLHEPVYFDFNLSGSNPVVANRAR